MRGMLHNVTVLQHTHISHSFVESFESKSGGCRSIVIPNGL